MSRIFKKINQAQQKGLRDAGGILLHIPEAPRASGAPPHISGGCRVCTEVHTSYHATGNQIDGTSDWFGRFDRTYTGPKELAT